MMHRTRGRVGAVVAALAVVAGMTPFTAGVATAVPVAGPTAAVPVATPAEATPASAAKKADPVDAVTTPKLRWYRCYETAQCTTVKVPLDYDRPTGKKVELALLRVKARDSKHRIGSLFVNPGGPGGSGTQLAAAAPFFLSEKVLDRFDVVGMDPRGIAYSDNVTCLSPRTQEAAFRGYAPGFPLGSAQEKAWIASDRALGKGCSNDRLAKSMSTTEVARDMELMRRAVGDKKLTYLGFSYGTYLGQVYANLFPDRFRAVAVDGVLDPVAWAGDASNVDRPLEGRLSSASGAYKALHEILVRCDRAGGAKCSFAAGDPVANLEVIADRLRAEPAVIVDEDFGDTYTITYQDMVSWLLGALYDPAGYQEVVDLLSELSVVTEPPNPDARGTDARRAPATAALVKRIRTTPTDGSRPRWAFPYENGVDAFASVTCTDSTERTTSAQYPGLAAQADQKAPYFGRLWLWGSSVCADDAFTGEDEDAYRGPFDTKTDAPVLYVGDYYDPATNYAGAVSASRRMPNSRLLSSDSFGHTAYGTSSCTTSAVDAYLLAATLPKQGKVCVGDVQPFESDPGELEREARRQAALNRPLPGPFPRHA